ncbi:MAG: SRPBCC family protein [Bacteroidales bacterium]
MKIEKSIVINRDSMDLYNYLRITRNQDNFSTWNMADPAKKTTSKGTDGTVGFVYSWDSTDKNVGAGEQELTGLTEGKRIDYDIRFFRPMKNVAKASFIISGESGKNSNVTWSFDSPSKFPFSLLTPIFKKMLGKDMAKSLDNLKSLMEK